MERSRDRIPNDLLGDPDPLTYLDRKPFKDYCQMISDIIHAADHALCIGEIHRELADRKQERWTADALEMISGIEEASIQPTRYRPRNRPDIPIMLPANEPLNLIFANSFTPQI